MIIVINKFKIIMLTNQHKIQIPHPASQYSRYKSQSKTNALLNRLSADSGYPQDIILSPNLSISKNYQHLNKRNLKNFFTDRLPVQQFKLANLNQTFDPCRIYQIKRQQYQLRHNGQSALNRSLKISSQQQIHKQRIRKISEIFSVNDKSLQLKLKYSDSLIKDPEYYLPENHRRGTKSSVEKKKSLTKKQAYQKVDVSGIVKPHRQYNQNKKSLYKTDNNCYYKSANVPLKIPAPLTILRQKQTVSKDRLIQFRRLIGRIKENTEGFSSNIHQKDLEKIQKKQQVLYQNTQADPANMIQWIRSCSKQYENQYNKNTTAQLKDIDDIQKIDPEFYQKMHEHKSIRLSKRMNLIGKNSVQKVVNSPPKRYREKEEDKLSIISDFSIVQFAQTKFISIKTSQNPKKATAKQKIMSLIAKITKLLQYKAFYGIDKQNIYSAFWKLCQPYQKQGSYSFFKAIKRGEIDAVKAFIQTDIEYAFQVDQNKRSPLINAVRYNHEDIVEYLLNIGIHVDAECNAKKRALYYAINNLSSGIVQKLLQRGAQPWSSKNCNYNQLKKTAQIQRLLKNAKKIHIACRLQKWVQRVQFWNTNRRLIVPNKIIDFNKKLS